MKLKLIRGVPGTGKSTLARSLGILHLEADMFHMKDGYYSYDPSRGKLAHRWCQIACWNALQSSMDVVVSNTFTTKKELQPYLDMVADLGCDVEVIALKHVYGSTHNVPVDVIQKMLDRWEELDGEVFK